MLANLFRPRTALDSFLALGRAFAPFLFGTFDDCFLRLAMVDPFFGWRSANADATLEETTHPESRQPTLWVINRRSQLGHDRSRLVLLPERLRACRSNPTVGARGFSI